MKCELCHQADAETAIQKTVDGSVRELFVCSGCARRQQTPAPDEPPGDSSDDAPAQVTAEIMIELLFGTEVKTGGRRSGERPPCPGCGLTGEEFRKHSRLGCSACYDHFTQDLAPLLRDMHSGEHHVGKVPRRAMDAVLQQRLEAELADAVARQQFEQAAVLRDRLRAHAPVPPGGQAAQRRGADA